MLKDFVQIINKSYQWSFSEVVVLKRSTKITMSSDFRKGQQKCNGLANSSKSRQNLSVRLSQSNCFKVLYKSSNEQRLS